MGQLQVPVTAVTRTTIAAMACARLCGGECQVVVTGDGGPSARPPVCLPRPLCRVVRFRVTCCRPAVVSSSVVAASVWLDNRFRRDRVSLHFFNSRRPSHSSVRYIRPPINPVCGTVR
ncbi:hypothetical protein ACI65C_010103 [Semiaphis heraclei]